MIEDRTWKTVDGEVIGDILEVFRGLMAEGERQVHVGTDSQQSAEHTEYVTVLVVLKEGKGGRVFYTNERVPRVRSLRERLMREVWTSVNLGLELNAHIPETSDLTIHIDANPNVKFRSSDFVKELTAMVVSQGFKSLLKPDSWAATHAADHVVKNKIIAMSKDRRKGARKKARMGGRAA